MPRYLIGKNIEIVPLQFVNNGQYSITTILIPLS